MGACAPKPLPAVLKEGGYAPNGIRQLRFGETSEEELNEAIEVLAKGFCGTKDVLGEPMFDWVQGSSDDKPEIRDDPMRNKYVHAFSAMFVHGTYNFGQIYVIDAEDNVAEQTNNNSIDFEAPIQTTSKTNVNGKKRIAACACVYPPGRKPVYEGWNMICKFMKIWDKLPWKHDKDTRPENLPKDIARRFDIFGKHMKKMQADATKLLKQKSKNKMNFEKCHYVAYVACHPDFNRQGYGKKLMTGFEQALSNKTRGAVYLLECGERQSGFYEKCGYNKIREQAYVMEDNKDADAGKMNTFTMVCNM